MSQEKSNLEEIIALEDLQKVFQYIDSVRFGMVTLVIQNGKVVQIEKTEKFKLK